MDLVVKDGMTPSAQIIADANRVVVVKDTKGRAIEIKRLDMAANIRIAKAISAENAAKPSYISLVNLAACVVSIDGDPVSPPRTELQFEALLERLGVDGYTAVAVGMSEHLNDQGDSDPGK